MKEPHVEGLAIHDDPESCAVTRKGAGEALTGAPAGWVLSREKVTPKHPLSTVTLRGVPPVRLVAWSVPAGC